MFKASLKIPGKSFMPKYQANVVAALTRILGGISHIVYHYTGIQEAVVILKENRFKLSTAVDEGEGRFRSPKDTKKGKFYFLSTTRQKEPKSFGGKHGDVNFVLDGRALATKYSGTPMEFYGTDIKEAEDRVWAKEPSITADKYITEIHVLEGKGAGAVITEAEGLGIPIFLYDDRAAWKVTNKAKAIPLEGDTEVDKPFEHDLRRLDHFVAFYEEDNIQDLTKDQLRNLRDLFGRDGWETLVSRTKNVEKDPATPKIIKILQNNRWTSLREFYDYLADKWRDQWDKWRLGD